MIGGLFRLFTVLLARFRVLGILGLSLILSLVIASSAQSEGNPDLLWVAQDNAVFGYSKEDYSVVVQISNLQRTVREVVPDIERDRLWVFNDQGLLAFNLAGEFQQITPFTTADANTARLELNPNDGFVWLTAGRRLFIFNNEGIEKYDFTFRQIVSGVSVDIINDRVWISTRRNIVALAIVDSELTEVDRIRSGRRVFDIAVNPATGVLWVGANNRLRRYPDNTGFDLNFNISDINRLRVAESGDVFVVTSRSLTRVFADGPIAYTILPFFGGTGIQDLIVDEATQSVWVSRNRRLRQFDFDGNRLENIRLPRAVRDLAVAQDRNSPEIEFVIPENSDLIAIDELAVSLSVNDSVNNLNQDSLIISINDEPLAVDCNFEETGIDCTPTDTSDLTEGPAELRASIEDNAGNISNTALVIITLSDAIEPLSVTLDSPQDGETFANGEINFQGNLNRAAELTINGVTIALGDSFNFNHPITLDEGTNAFTLIADDGNEQVTISLSVILDTSLPSITLTTPENGLITNQPSLVISGLTTDTETLTVNDESISLNPDDSFILSDITLIEGDNLFIFVATDANDNNTILELSVTLDTIAPQISISTPADGSITGAEPIEISGSLSETADLSLNGNPVSLSETNSFSLPDVPLQEGDNSFTFIATDSAGNSSQESLTVTRDSQAPVITITSPENNSATNQEQITISGSVEGADQLSLNGQPISLNPDGSFSSDPITLVEGLNTLTLVATDTVGNRAELILSITLDTVAPIITITSPLDGSITQESSVDIVGSLSEPVTLTLDGNTTTLAEDNSFNLTNTALNEGENTFILIATDSAGNSTEGTIRITRDSAAPIIMITSPQNNSITNQTEITISGSVDDASVVTLNGNLITVNENGSFSEGPITLGEGGNSFAFNAQDAAGNSSELVITVTLDSITPVITITEPVDGLVTTGEEQGFTGNISEVADLTFNGVTIPLALDNSFSITPIPLNAGANTFTFTATDAAGNNSQIGVSVIRDNVSPIITISSPANNSLTTVDNVEVTGGVSEPLSLTLNGSAVAVNGDLSFSTNVSLSEGENTLTFIAIDSAGLVGQQVLLISRDSIPPTTPNASLIIRNTAQSGIISVQGNNGSVEANVTVRITNIRTNEIIIVTANSDGGFNALINGESNDVLSVTSVDIAGNESGSVNIAPPSPPSLTLMPIGNQLAPLGQRTSFNVIAMSADDVELIVGVSPTPLPEGMEFNALTGAFEYVPVLAQVGSFDLTFTAMTDSEQISETVTFTVPEPDGITRLSGRVITENDAPLPGVRFEIGGVETFSNAEGLFNFDNLPVSGDVRLLVDGSTVDVSLGRFATVPENIPLVEGADNNLLASVILLPLDMAAADPVDPNSLSIITSSASIGILGETLEPVTLTVPARSAFNDDGTPFEGDIVITRVDNPADGPQPLPEDIGLSYYISIQPFGVTYPQPVPISFPNPDGLDPETIVDMFALDHETGRFEIVGQGQVSSSGLTVDSIGGVVSNNSWHGFAILGPDLNPESTDLSEPKKDEDDDCAGCRIGLTSGNLAEDHSLPPYYSLGKAREIKLTYNSQLANPRPIIRADTQFNTLNFSNRFRFNLSAADAMSFQLSIGGVETGLPRFMESDNSRGSFRVGRQFNGAPFPSGLHEYELTMECFQRVGVGRSATPGSQVRSLGGTRSNSVRGTVLIENESYSAFGAGWTLNGLQRIYLGSSIRPIALSNGPDPLADYVMLSEGDGSSYLFIPIEEEDEDSSTGGGVSSGGSGSGSGGGTIDPNLGRIVPLDYESPQTDFSVLRRLEGGAFVRRMKDGTVYNFDENGFQTSMVDRNGNMTQYQYSGGRLTRITDPTGRQYNFSYSGGRIQSINDPLNRITRFVHDNDGNLIRIIEPNGDERSFEYQANHLMISQTDQRENRKEYTFGPEGRIQSVLLADNSLLEFSPSSLNGVITGVDGIGSSLANLAPRPTNADQVENTLTDQNANFSTSQVDENHVPTMRTDAVDRVTLFERDEDSLPLATTRSNGSSISRTFDDLGNPTLIRENFNGAEYRYTYDNNSLVTSFLNPRGNTYIINRDTRGNALEILNPLQHRSIMEYDSRGLVTRSVSPNNLVTTYTYNDQGLAETMTETPPAGSPGNVRFTRYSYDAAGQMTQVITPDNITLNVVYDSKGRVTRITDNLNQAIGFTYDPYNNLIQTDTTNSNASLALRVQQAFDVRNRLVEIRAPHNGVEDSVMQRLLDPNSNLVGLVDPNGNPSSNAFDGEDRLIENTHRLNGITRYTYDTNDRITRVIAPNGVVTSYTYDSIARRTAEFSSDRGRIRYEYDLANNLIQVVDGRGVVVNMNYDELERVTTKTFPNTIAGKIEDVTNVYDNCGFGLGYLCARNDESGNYTYDYDAFGNAVSMTFTEIAGVEYSMGYVYDDGDNIVQSIYPSGRVVNYGRDAVRRINQIQTGVASQSINLVDNITYRGDNQMLTYTYGNGLTDNRSYDLQGRLVAQQLASDSSIIDSRSYSYDQNSNILNIDTNFEDNGYSYDALDRIIADTINTDQPINFSYDLNDNRLAKAFDQNTLNFNYSTSNRLNARVGILTPTDATVIAGSYNSRELRFNDANRLYQLIEDGTLKAEYIYNDNGQRTRKTTFQTDGQTVVSVTVYHYDHMGYLIEETTDTGTLIKDYIWQEGMYPVAQIDNTSGSEQVLYLYNDHLKTNRLATDQNQNIVWRWEGEAFGNTPAQELAGLSVNLRFPGQYFDEETNLHYNHFRYYDPELGRYITSDPIGLLAGLNTYSYVGQNPAAYIDIYGLCLSSTSRDILLGTINGAFTGLFTGGLPGFVLGGLVGGTVAAAQTGATGNAVLGAAASSAVASFTRGRGAATVSAAAGSTAGGGALGGAAGGLVGGAIGQVVNSGKFDGGAIATSALKNGSLGLFGGVAGTAAEYAARQLIPECEEEC